MRVKEAFKELKGGATVVPVKLVFLVESGTWTETGVLHVIGKYLQNNDVEVISAIDKRSVQSNVMGGQTKHVILHKSKWPHTPMHFFPNVWRT